MLNTLIEDLLDLSRLDQGSVTLYLVPVDVNRLVTDLVSDRLGLVARRALMLEARPTPDLPHALADPGRLLQVITNLLTNAMNYTPSGGHIVLRTQTQKARDRDWVTLSVSDTGPGIPNDELPNIFQRLYRGMSARESNVPGTGLGLAICEELIQHQEGFFTVESGPGAGSKFTVWLPITGS